MPEHEQWVYIDTSTSGTSTTGSIWNSDTDFYDTIPQYIQQQYDEYKQECERQDRIYEQQMQMVKQQMEEERQLKEDKRKYPLFFWRELCSEKERKHISVNEHMKQRKENI